MVIMCKAYGTAHDDFRKERRPEVDDLLCVLDFPIRREGYDPAWYWGWTDEDHWVAFDDATRVAWEYPPPEVNVDPIPGPHEAGDPTGRPYTVEENARADWLATSAAQAQAQLDYERAVGINAAPAELAALQEANQAASGIKPGDPWVQPTGAHDAYPLDALVSHNGNNWRSTIAANVWEPGVSGWVQDGAGIPDWVQPTGAHDAYALGAVVRHISKVWQSNVDANVWEPPTQWTEIPDPEA